MVKRVPHISIPDEVIMSRIYLIRGQKVMLDRDLAELYEVETKQIRDLTASQLKIGSGGLNMWIKF